MRPVRRALISVHDKRGVAEFARGLAGLGVSVISTGGTARHLRAAGVCVTEVSDFTGVAETLGGRVKTLHPKLHAGILACRDSEAHRLEMERAMVSLCGVQVVVGAQTKVLEAMGCGTPVVSTPAGNYGIDGVSGRELHVAEGAEAFAARAIELLEGQGWDDMSAAGRRLVLDRFAPARAGAQLERAIQDAVAARRRR